MIANVRATRTVDDVIARMRAIDAELPRGDGVAAFNRVYLEVTERVRDGIGQGFFRDPALMQRMDVEFARLYFAAYEAGGTSGAQAPPAWAPLFEARRRRGVAPIQHALAGMNAHINNDLALAVVTTCTRARRAPRDVHADYLKVNEVLASVVRPIRQSFLDEHVVRAGAPLSPLADLVSSWSLDRARDYAWVQACTLYQLRGTRRLAAAYRASLARTVGLVGRQMLVAVPGRSGIPVASRGL